MAAQQLMCECLLEAGCWYRDSQCMITPNERLPVSTWIRTHSPTPSVAMETLTLLARSRSSLCAASVHDKRPIMVRTSENKRQVGREARNRLPWLPLVLEQACLQTSNDHVHPVVVRLKSVELFPLEATMLSQFLFASIVSQIFVQLYVINARGPWPVLTDGPGPRLFLVLRLKQQTQAACRINTVLIMFAQNIEIFKFY